MVRLQLQELHNRLPAVKEQYLLFEDWTMRRLPLNMQLIALI